MANSRTAKAEPELLETATATISKGAARRSFEPPPALARPRSGRADRSARRLVIKSFMVSSSSGNPNLLADWFTGKVQFYGC